ncbi:hypothetical protein VPHK356_0120 [Vibrio phage K356]|nr:hypothetical protein MYOV002v2_p0113 [Vibrio phage 144E46.1]
MNNDIGYAAALGLHTPQASIEAEALAIAERPSEPVAVDFNEYTVTAYFTISSKPGKTVFNTLTSLPIKGKAAAEKEAQNMVDLWGASNVEVKHYDSEPADDGYDMDKYGG